MNHHIVRLASVALTGFAIAASAADAPPPATKNPVPLFDGKTLAGWEGDAKLWRVQDGCLTGGSLEETVKRNEFLATTRDYTNFIVRFQIRLLGSNGFVNSGFQIRSQRVPKNSEMAGYQCDYGEPNWYGAIYDESRRNKVMSASDMKALRPALGANKEAWNDYVIRADGPRVTTWINGAMGTDYTEADASIVDWGKLGIQVHGGGKAIVQVRNITIEELPPTPPGKKFIPAPEPKKSARHNEANRGAAQTASKAEAVSPEEEKARFTLSPGFEVELVVAEDLAAGFGKFVAVDWDQHGNLWTMTALEYPVDGNENPASAKELYASKAKDKVLVYDRDAKSPTGYASKPRVFAEGLAIPLGILPYKNGVYVQHGTEIVFLSDTDGDGKADKREVILGGFGVQDSHLFPHQFTRAPGGWMWMAQGAFNYGKVKTARGEEIQFDQTRMARFRPDGSAFEITSQGPCNIWGLHMTMEGETWIQEANDFGYPAMPFHEHANYPGCSGGQWKSYAPEFPGTAPDFRIGGTGLSGLAISDVAANDEGRMTNDEKNATARASGHSSFVIRHSSFPPAYADVIYIANPITRKIQGIKAHRDGPRWRLQLLGDFVQSSDEMFRPVALRLGPDGCLYIVDWYNKIISHNEVARNHPDRDKKRGRIWRVKHSEQKLPDVPDFAKLSGDELIAKLGGKNATQSHLAWQAIGDRQLKELGPKLKAIVGDKAQTAARRIAALWALEGIQQADTSTIKALFADASRNVRREAVRAAGEAGLAPGEIFYGSTVSHDSDPEVRSEVIRAAGRFLANNGDGAKKQDAANAVRVLINGPDLAPLDGPTMKSTQNGKTIKTGAAYEREFERYLVRLFLEKQPKLVAEFLALDSQGRSTENTILATLALEPKSGATPLARAMPSLKRAPNQEELLRLAQFPDEPGVGEALKKILQQPETSQGAVAALLNVRTKLDATKITPLLNDAAKQLLAQNNEMSLALGTKLASSFQLAAVEPELVRVLEQGWGGYPKLEAKEYLLRPESLAALQALRELKSDRVDLFAKLAEKGGTAEREAAVAALAVSRDPRGPQQLASLYPGLPPAVRRTALASLSGTRPGAGAVVKAVKSGAIAKDELDAATLDKLHAVLGEDKDLAALMAEMASLFQPVLRLDGKPASYADTKLTLSGPFTVETWAKLEGAIGNQDGILGTAGELDMNFYGGQFRVWAGGGLNDVVVAKKKTVAGVWAHYAVTRDAQGVFRIYVNGELDATGTKTSTAAFNNLGVGRTSQKDTGTDGWLSEYRVWNRTRTPEEIRADFDRSYDGDARPAGLTHLLAGTNWGKLHGTAKVMKTSNFPPLLAPAEAKALAEKFTKFRALAEKAGSTAHGQEIFTTLCAGCHSVGGRGGQVGPVLNGAGASGVETLLRSVLTPNAAMEAGYRVFRVELKDGDVLDGMMVSQDKDAIVLRRPNVEDARLPISTVRRADFTRRSMMPEGLIEALPEKDVTDLLAYLKTLK